MRPEPRSGYPSDSRGKEHSDPFKGVGDEEFTRLLAAPLT
jgi:hypothetical protein